LAARRVDAIDIACADSAPGWIPKNDTLESFYTGSTSHQSEMALAAVFRAECMSGFLGGQKWPLLAECDKVKSSTEFTFACSTTRVQDVGITAANIGATTIRQQCRHRLRFQHSTLSRFPPDATAVAQRSNDSVANFGECWLRR
jgi:hypothetical protein